MMPSLELILLVTRAAASLRLLAVEAALHVLLRKSS